MRTTLNKIREHQPCKDGWEKLLRHLNKMRPDDEPLPLEEILNSNGLGDALWCSRAVEGHDREMRLYAVWCARQIQHLMTDPRSVAALDIAERYARGQASQEKLKGAWEAAWEAARESARAERAAAAWEAAWEATAAARQAASVAAAAAWEAARVAWDAMAAAREQAAIDAQVTEFRRVCREIAAGRDPYPMGDMP